MTLPRSMAETRGLARFPLVSGVNTPYVCAAPSPKSGSYANPQRRHHRPCRSWQDHARGQAARPVRRVPRASAGRRARARPQRPGKGARHHHPGQMHLGGVEGHADQHRRHPRPRRFRRRGRAHPEHGGRRHRAGRRRRGRAAADQVRGRQGAGPRHPPDRRGQQGRPPGRPPRRSPHRGLRPVRRARRLRQPARFPDAVRLRPPGLGRRNAGRAAQGPVAAVRPGASATCRRRR